MGDDAKQVQGPGVVGAARQDAAADGAGFLGAACRKRLDRELHRGIWYQPGVNGNGACGGGWRHRCPGIG